MSSKIVITLFSLFAELERDLISLRTKEALAANRSQTASQQVPLIIDHQVQFKAEEPAHTGLPSSGVSGKDTMGTDPFGIAHFQRGRVSETDPCARPITALQINQQGDLHGRYESDKALATDQARKFAPQMDLDMFSVIGFKVDSLLDPSDGG
jgi:hypothetical protein